MTAVRFDGRSVLVTGAGRGLGRSHAIALAARGAAVLVNDMDTAAAESVAAEILAGGGQALANDDPVDDPAAAARMVAVAVEAFGGLHAVVNNAGFLRDRTFLKMSIEDIDAIVRVHLLGACYVTHAAWPRLCGQRYGRVVLTTSTSGLYGVFGQANYGAAKLGLVGLMNALRLEGDRCGVKVNTIAPLGASRLADTAFPPKALSKMDPAWVSGVVAYLTSEVCRESGLLLHVGAGRLSRAAIAESDGLAFAALDDADPDRVAAALPELMRQPLVHRFDNAGAAVRRMLAGAAEA